MTDLFLESVQYFNFEHIKLLFYILFAASVLISIAIRFTAWPKSSSGPSQTSLGLEKPRKRPESSSAKTERPFGTWIPSDFQRPVATPYPDWDVHKTEPLPYRPFKWGPYYITMGLRSLPWDDWIELDNRYTEFHAIKKARIEERGPKCNITAPEAYDAAIELLDEL